jgi:hypothetical protein
VCRDQLSGAVYLQGYEHQVGLDMGLHLQHGNATNGVIPILNRINMYQVLFLLSALAVDKVQQLLGGAGYLQIS